MRPYLPDQIERVRDITRPYLATHGEPMAWGWEAVEELGIIDIKRPEFGDAVTFREGEVPVFWVMILQQWFDIESEEPRLTISGLWRNAPNCCHGGR